MKQIVQMMMLVLLCSFAASAQKISGTVKDTDGKTLTNANVVLMLAKDSSVIKMAVTDGKGIYEFNGVKPGKYITSASYVGYASLYSAPFSITEKDFQLPDMAIAKASGELKNVTVTARKPMIEVRADKTIVNVENTINATGNDGLELLRKSPGVTIDKDDNLSLAGKNGVQVYVDGKPSPLSGSDLTNYLKSLQASQIEAIEIITNPSAKYEAAGNAGIINIKLKKNKAFGTNGSIGAGYNIGIFPKYNGNLSLNHRNKKINLFGNYNYNKSRGENYMSLYRIIADTLFDQHSNMTSRNNSHGFKAGMDYFADSKNTFGIMVNGNISDNSFANDSKTPITYLPTNTLVKILEAHNTSQGNRDNINVNANYRFADTSGHELNMDADYGWYKIRNDQLQPNYYYDPITGAITGEAIYNMVAPSDINIYSFKTDYEQNFMKGRLGFGGKISYVNSGNDFQRYDVINNGKYYDTLRSNNFAYKENINALYVNYNRQYKGFMIQAGLRAENTNATGVSKGYKTNQAGYEGYDSSFKRNYTGLFPSAAITFNKNPMSQWSLSYSRRIDRPAYQDLNPFEFKLDEYTYQKGNTMLTPQYTNSITVSNTYKYKLTTSLTFSHVNDVFTRLIDTTEKSKAFMTKKNLAKQNLVSLNISYPIQIKWYSAFFNANTNYSHYQADFGTGRTIDLDAFTFSIFGQNNFKVAKTTTLELSGWYNSPSIWQGTFKSKEMWSIDAGVQQQVLKGKGTIKATVTDIFKTMTWSGVSNFAGQYLRASGGWESRQFRINFTYRFGSNQVKAQRQRSSGSDDENKRVGSQGGGIGG